jgi:hypothetical protein
VRSLGTLGSAAGRAIFPQSRGWRNRQFGRSLCSGEFHLATLAFWLERPCYPSPPLPMKCAPLAAAPFADALGRRGKKERSPRRVRSQSTARVRKIGDRTTKTVEESRGGRGGTDVWQTKDFKSNDCGCVAMKGLREQFSGCVATKGVSGGTVKSRSGKSRGTEAPSEAKRG